MNKITCPDCNRKQKLEVKNGYQYCNKCLQMILIENEQAVKCVPKELVV